MLLHQCLIVPQRGPQHLITLLTVGYRDPLQMSNRRVLLVELMTINGEHFAEADVIMMIRGQSLEVGFLSGLYSRHWLVVPDVDFRILDRFTTARNNNRRLPQVRIVVYTTFLCKSNAIHVKLNAIWASDPENMQVSSSIRSTLASAESACKNANSISTSKSMPTCAWNGQAFGNIQF